MPSSVAKVATVAVANRPDGVGEGRIWGTPTLGIFAKGTHPH